MSSTIETKEENNDEKKIAINLMKEIFQYENKIKEINDLLIINNTDLNQNYTNLSELKKRKYILEQRMSEQKLNIIQNIRNKDEQLKLKESLKNELENKIEQYKYKLNTFNSLTFNPIITKQLFPNNNKNDLLSNEEINEFILNSKKTVINYNDNNNMINDINKNKNLKKELMNKIYNIQLKINKTNEQLKMLKEEKISIKNELINIISCKESIDALIKFNHYLIKNYKEIQKNNPDYNNIDKEIYHTNKWTKPLLIYFYEMSIINIDQFSNGFNDIILDIYDINNKSLDSSINNKDLIKKNENLELSPISSLKNNCYSNKVNNNYITNFSIIKILKNEFESYIKKNKNNCWAVNQNNTNNFLEKISKIIINKINSIVNLNYLNKKFLEINNNIIIYLSYYIKSLYYDKIINSNLKFINKDYKYKKKELQTIIIDLNIDLKKLEMKKNELHQQKKDNEGEIKIMNNEEKKRLIQDDLKNGNSIVSKREEKEYLQLFLKINILTKIIFCYFRKIEKNKYIKYNPLNKISNENLSKSPFYFMSSSISLNKSYNSIRVALASKLDPIDINIKDIQYTIVTNSLKTIIEIYRDYKKFIKKEGDKDQFIKKEIEKYSNLNYDYINKCINNNKFNFIMFTEGNTQYEFLFCSYEDFKMWINGIAFIIKNRNKIPLKKLLEILED